MEPEKNKKTPIIIALSVIALFLILIVIGRRVSERKEATKVPETLSLKGSIYLSESASSEEGLRTVDVNFKKSEHEITSIAAEITYKYDTEPVLPVDAVDIKQDLQIKPNSELIEAGWVYMLNKVETDPENKTVSVQIALAYLNTSGYIFDQDLPIASLSFEDSSLTNPLELSLSTENTKAVTENNDQIDLTLTGITL